MYVRLNKLFIVMIGNQATAFSIYILLYCNESGGKLHFQIILFDVV